MHKSKAMAPHSSSLAWKIPWMEEPGRLQSMGSHRVGHDWSDLAAAAVLRKLSFIFILRRKTVRCMILFSQLENILKELLDVSFSKISLSICLQDRTWNIWFSMFWPQPISPDFLFHQTYAHVHSLNPNLINYLKNKYICFKAKLKDHIFMDHRSKLTDSPE